MESVSPSPNIENFQVSLMSAEHLDDKISDMNDFNNCSRYHSKIGHDEVDHLSEFNQLGFNSSQNLTDFQTRVVWSSSTLRQHIQQMSYSMTPILLSNSIVLTDPFNDNCPSDIKPKLSAPNLYHGQMKTPSKSSNKDNQIWRPFSPEPMSIPMPTYPDICDTQQEIKNSTVWPSDREMFPTIVPSLIKLGGSTKSVFKAVKRKRYQCLFCSMSYLNKSQLSGHIRVHTGSKPYRCEYPGCSRAFARNEELTRHRRIHSGFKPHHCDICKKQFGRKDHLNKHRKTHLKTSEKKVYLCQVPGCGHRYTRSDALTRHQTTAHVIKHARINSMR